MPLSTPDRVSVFAALGLRTPPPRVTFRAELNDDDVVVTSVPPFSVTAPVPPRLLSAATCSVPTVMVVPPV